MRLFPDKHFALAIVDPPYGINATNMKMGESLNRKDGSIHKPTKGRLNQGGGKLKNRLLNKSAFSWDNETPTEEYFKELFRISRNQIIWGGNYFHLPPTRGIVAWNKMQPWENFSQFELAWTSFDKPAKLISLSNTGGANKETKFHPTQKPTKLYEYLLKHFSNPGDNILDSHVGSGSSRIAAHNFNLDFTGYEINKEYFYKQEERYQNHSLIQTIQFPT
jgi:site-specific DNA-methyltransferase (adenine-specific)